MTRYDSGPVAGTETVAITAGTSVRANVVDGQLNAYVPDNCHTIIIYNSDAANTLLVSMGGVAANPLGGALTGDIMRVPPLGTLTLALGNKENRISSTWSSGGAEVEPLYDASAGNTTVAFITYVCGIQG
jgi:hypothetical protein